MNLAMFVHSDQQEEEDEVDKLFSSPMEIEESLISGQCTTSRDNSGRTTVSTASDIGITMEPTTNLQASSNDVTYSSHDTLDHTQLRTTFATVNKEALQTFALIRRGIIAQRTVLTRIKRYETWRKARDIQQSLENISADKLDEVLQSACALCYLFLIGGLERKVSITA